MFAPTQAWMGTLNIWRGMNSLSLRTSTLPAAWASCSWTTVDSGAASSLLIMTSSRTSGDSL